MKYYDRNTGLLIEDTDASLLNGKATDQSLQEALSKCILSASGWRAVMTESGDEEDRRENVNEEMLLIAAAAAASFMDYLKIENPRIILGTDARPTGRPLAAAIRRAFIAKGAILDDIFISSAPEIMAASHRYDGFFYISASHNPIGHNGYKFGIAGGVLNKDEIDKVIPSFRAMVNAEGAAENLRKLIRSADENKLNTVLKNHNIAKRRALDTYKSFIIETAKTKEPFTLPFGIAIDFNGSARSASIDKNFLRNHDAKIWAINSEPGQIAHAIVPEGENLEFVRKILEEQNSRDKSFIIGYMPDNDGDRGNFVYTDKRGKSHILSAQVVFALVAAIELSYDAMRGKKKIAIAVNGPTSLLIDEMAKELGVSVFRSDIGEANVVMLSEKLREEGWTCRVCGEGSNGGNITYPAKVRDPMNSLMTFSKLWSVSGLYKFIMEKLGKKPDEEPSLYSVLSALPKYLTTSAFSKEAVMHIKSNDYNTLKAEYERILEYECNGRMPGIFSRWEVRQYEGSAEDIGIGTEHRTPNSTGGLKVQFYDATDKPVAYLWLSKSRTEPVIRTMVDIKGNDRKLHDELLAWQREMVQRADAITLNK